MEETLPQHLTWPGRARVNGQQRPQVVTVDGLLENMRHLELPGARGNSMEGGNGWGPNHPGEVPASCACLGGGDIRPPPLVCHHSQSHHIDPTVAKAGTLRQLSPQLPRATSCTHGTQGRGEKDCCRGTTAAEQMLTEGEAAAPRCHHLAGCLPVRRPG